MQKPVDYINDIKGAIEDADVNDVGKPKAESLLVYLSARGLLVVEVPHGVSQTFTGLPHHA